MELPGLEIPTFWEYHIINSEGEYLSSHPVELCCKNKNNGNKRYGFKYYNIGRKQKKQELH